MSAEVDFRAAMLAHAPLAALVTKIAQNGVDEGVALPYIVFTASHEPIGTLDQSAGETVIFTVECWAATAAMADQVAVEVIRACVTVSQAVAASATLISRASGFDAELGLDACICSIEWWT